MSYLLLITALRGGGYLAGYVLGHAMNFAVFLFALAIKRLFR